MTESERKSVVLIAASQYARRILAERLRSFDLSVVEVSHGYEGLLELMSGGVSAAVLADGLAGLTEQEFVAFSRAFGVTRNCPIVKLSDRSESSKPVDGIQVLQEADLTSEQLNQIFEMPVSVGISMQTPEKLVGLLKLSERVLRYAARYGHQTAEAGRTSSLCPKESPKPKSRIGEEKGERTPLPQYGEREFYHSPSSSNRSDQSRRFEDSSAPGIVRLVPDIAPMVTEFLCSLSIEVEKVRELVRNQEWKEGRLLVLDLAGNAGLFGYPEFSDLLTRFAELLNERDEEGSARCLEAVVREANRLASGVQGLSELESRDAEAELTSRTQASRTLADLTNDEQYFLMSFLRSFPEEFARVRTAFDQQDWSKVGFYSNELAGTAALSGLLELCEALLSIERLAKEGQVRSIEEGIEFAAKLAHELFVHARAQLGDLDLERSSSALGTQETRIITSELVETNPELIPLIQEFLSDIESYTQRLSEASQRKAWPILASVAHEIAGVAGMYGYPECRDISKKIQFAAQEEDSSGIDELLDLFKSTAAAMTRGV